MTKAELLMSGPKLAILTSTSLGPKMFCLTWVNDPLKPCRVTAMWGRPADRIDGLIAYHKVDVCTFGPERVVTG